MNVNNPYSDMVKLMQQHGAKLNPPSIQLGEVLSSSPLTVKTGDIQLNKNNLLIADYLLNNYQRKINVSTTEASGSTDKQTVGDHGEHSHGITEIGLTGSIEYTDTLNTGDIVALIQIDDATFLILCRVVKA